MFLTHIVADLLNMSWFLHDDHNPVFWTDFYLYLYNYFLNSQTQIMTNQLITF